MSFNDSMRNTGQMSVADQVNALGGTGRGLGTRRLAESWARVSGRPVRSEMRAVQRALKSGHAPVKQSEAARQAGAQRAAAARMRAARTISVGTGGKVPVISKSAGVPRGSLKVSLLVVDDQARRELEQAAADYESGNVDEAQRQLSETIIGLHAVSKGDNRNTAREWIEVENFDGLDFT